MLRLFIALSLPATIRDRLAGVQRALAVTGIPYRWAHADGLHLTLLFLGPRDDADVPLLEAAMRRAAAGYPSLHLGVTALGGFPDLTRPRILWAGLDGDLAALDALQRDLEREVRASDIAFECQPFRPHITLGRARARPAPLDVARLGRDATVVPSMGAALAPAFGAWTAPAVDLVRSDLRPGGPVYTTIFRAPLGDDRTAPGHTGRRPAPPAGSTEEAS